MSRLASTEINQLNPLSQVNKSKEHPKRVSRPGKGAAAEKETGQGSARAGPLPFTP